MQISNAKQNAENNNVAVTRLVTQSMYNNIDKIALFYFCFLYRGWLLHYPYIWNVEVNQLPE